MTNRLVHFGLILGCFFCVAISKAKADWAVQASAGTAYNFESDLTIEQPGQDDIRLDADYETRGFEGPIYYMLRVGHTSDRRYWEVEFIHHKLFLKNLPSGIDRFSISHGYNLLLINFAWRKESVIFRGGGGLVIAHPETMIRGVEHEPGYIWGGPAGQLSLEFRIPIQRHLFLSAETKLTFARVSVDLNPANATVPNVALHGLFGIGMNFE